MRSQKQNNRSPRPFKMPQDKFNWSGGNRKGAFPPLSKLVMKPTKPVLPIGATTTGESIPDDASPAPAIVPLADGASSDSSKVSE